jgi:hypothetical protein
MEQCAPTATSVKLEGLGLAMISFRSGQKVHLNAHGLFCLRRLVAGITTATNVDCFQHNRSVHVN